jgi:hypothetical protein
MLLGEVDSAKELQLSSTLNLVTESEIRRSLAALKEDSDSFRRGERFEWPIPDEF